MTIDITKLRADTLALLDGTTPGPWQRDCWDILGSGVGVGTGSVCEVARQNGDDNKYWKYGEAEANVKLIAAAPTLAADNLRLIDDNLRLLDEIERLKRALVEAAIPLEAMILATQDDTAGRRLYGELLWNGIVAGVEAVRTALPEGGPDDR